MTVEPIPQPEQVNHPDHYNHGSVECIDVIEWLPCNLANAVKYVWRAGHKGDIVTDLKKALWYVKREEKRLTSSKFTYEAGRCASFAYTLGAGEGFSDPDQHLIILGLLEVDFGVKHDSFDNALSALTHVKIKLSSFIQRIETSPDS